MTRLMPLIAISLFLYLIVMLSLNVSFFPRLPSYDERRIIELGIIAASLMSFILKDRIFKGFHLHWKGSMPAAMLLLLGLAAVSVCLSPSPRHAVQELGVLSGLGYVSCLSAALWQAYRQAMLQWLVYAMLLGVAIYLPGFYAGYLASFLEHMPLRWPEPFFGFSNIRAFNQYQQWTLGLLCLPLLAFNIQGGGRRRWLYLILAAWWVLAFVSVSRGVLLAWLLAVLVTAGVYRQLAWPLLRLQLYGFVSGLTGYAILFQIIPGFFVGGVAAETVIRATTNDRLELWNQAWDFLKSHPWFGVGPMHYAWYPNIIAAHPHNSVLQLAAEWGLPAFGLMLVLAAYGMYAWLNRFNYFNLQHQAGLARHLPIVLFFSVVANAAYSLVDGVIVMPLSQLMLAVVLGLMLGMTAGNAAARPKSPGQEILQRGLALLLLAALVWALLPELLPRVMGASGLSVSGQQAFGPRFWQDGGIPH